MLVRRDLDCLVDSFLLGFHDINVRDVVDYEILVRRGRVNL